MGLLEYQAMPSLPNLVHDGILCTFSNRPRPGQSVVVHQGRRHGPSITYKIGSIYDVRLSRTHCVQEGMLSSLYM